MQDIFGLEPNTNVPADSSYIKSYEAIRTYFSERDVLSGADVIRGSHMVYGWMPTILDLYSEPPNLSAEGAATILNGVKETGVITDDNLRKLVLFINNSLVGASKILHFISPETFPIWDPRIYSFVYDKKPYGYNVSKLKNYRTYMEKLSGLQVDERFPEFYQSVKDKVGYDVSKVRAIELVMFLNAPSWSS